MPPADKDAARMLVRRPELLVFDDLSSALDVETEQLLWDRLFNDGTGATALVVSHRKPALQRSPDGQRGGLETQ